MQLNKGVKSNDSVGRGDSVAKWRDDILNCDIVATNFEFQS